MEQSLLTDDFKSVLPLDGLVACVTNCADVGPRICGNCIGEPDVGVAGHINTGITTWGH